MEPINLLPLDGSPAAIERAADHAMMIGTSYLAKVADWVKRPVADLEVLELGPGPDFGAVLMLAAFGARVAVADRWLTPWQDQHHGPLYRTLADRIEAQYPTADVAPLRKLVAAKAYRPDIIKLYPDAEQLEGAAEAAFDLVLSNAVFEHVRDHQAAAARAYLVTKPGCLNVHQVDFRDHRDFSRPLEFLLLSAAEIEAFMRETDTHQGNPRRASEYQAAFEAVGFEVLSAWVTERTEETYLADFRRRLAAKPDAAYRNATIEDLSIGGITYVLRKPATPTAR